LPESKNDRGSLSVKQKQIGDDNGQEIQISEIQTHYTHPFPFNQGEK
jgi:hypothetical protein